MVQPYILKSRKKKIEKLSYTKNVCRKSANLGLWQVVEYDYAVTSTIFCLVNASVLVAEVCMPDFVGLGEYIFYLYRPNTTLCTMCD